MPDRSARPFALLFGALLLTVGLCSPDVQAQERPRPYQVMPPPRFDEAIEKGTRTETGAPGPDYWANTAEYDLQATLSPEKKKLRGEGTIRYQNHSPDTLRTLVVMLRQNIYKPSAPRRTGGLEVTGGVELAKVSVDGRPLVERSNLKRPGYTIDYTLMRICPAAPVPPGETVALELS